MPFLAGYTLRKPIVIDNTYVDSDLTDFPLLVKITADAQIGANIDASGLNIRFTASDGTTLLKYERQSFSVSGSATGIFWVKVPTVAGASDTTIYIYYKSASPSEGADVTNVWDTNFKLVAHMEQDPSGSAPQMLDSTSGGNNGTSGGSMGSGDLVPVKVGNGINFDGSDDFIAFTRPSGITAGGAWTVEMIARYIGSVSLENMFDLNDGTNNIATVYWWSAGHGMLGHRSNTVDISVCTELVSATDITVLHHWAFSWDGSSARMKIYVDGDDLSTGAGAFLSGTGVDAFSLSRGIGGAYQSPMDCDEVRLSAIDRPAAWIKFTYRNIFESDNEISFGSEESGGASASSPPFGRRSTRFFRSFR